MNAPDYIYLTVESDAVVASLNQGHAKMAFDSIESWEKQMTEWAQDWSNRRVEPTIMCSSSLDFPDEYTSKQSVMDLCNAIRNGEVEIDLPMPAIEKALRVLVQTKETFQWLQKNDPMALRQALLALGANVPKDASAQSIGRLEWTFNGVGYVVGDRFEEIFRFEK